MQAGVITSAETEERRHVDVALDPLNWSRALIIDECGGVWLWWENRVEAQERLIKTPRL